MDWIYLDNNATTQPAPQVVAAMQQAYEQWWANPSSVHRLGQSVRQQVELARATVGRLIGARPRQIIFTSGGTESNNIALRGLLQSNVFSGEVCRGILITTRIEHAAIREPAEAMEAGGAEVIYLPLSDRGLVDPAALEAVLREQAKERQKVLVSIQWANNETGVIQSMAQLSQVCRQARAGGSCVLLHADATQAVGKIPVDVGKVPVDLMTFSAHKFHGPKGVGALYVRSGVRLRAQNLGGPQEREKRGGTENTVGIIGMGAAAELAVKFVRATQEIQRLAEKRDQFERNVCEAVPEAVVNGATERLWNTTNIGFARLEAEAILLGLSERGVCASAGAACSSGSLEPSPVLLAMGVPEPIAHGSIRFSISRFTTEEELKQASKIVVMVAERLAQTMPIGQSVDRQ